MEREVGGMLSVAIVGGGTAGWMTANLLAHHWRDIPLEISLVDSAEIGTIGVGEGSTPYLKSFFRTLGISEKEWMPACDATYKCGIRFPGWSSVPGYESYFHPFYSPLDREVGAEFFAQADHRRRGKPVDANPDHFFHAPYLAEAGRAPIPKRPLPFEIDYAYHFDASLLGAFLKRKALQAGVVHQQATVERVRIEDAQISHLITNDGKEIQADFYIDCTGFRGSLLSQLPGYRYTNYANTLFNNAAVAVQVPEGHAGALRSETTSEALSNGWMWHIPLQSRTGYGYVYSDDFTSGEAAEHELRDRLGISDDMAFRHLKMRVGCVSEHWSGNCLGVGLSQGFIEPLEATALMLVQFTVEQFVRAFDPEAFIGASKDNRLMRASRARGEFNRTVNEMFTGVLDYVVGHYLLNSREDTEYWRAVREKSTVPDRLAQLLECWDRGGDFTRTLQETGADRVYSMASWYCLFAGMGRFPVANARSFASPARPSPLIADARAFCGGNTARFRCHRAQLAQLAQLSRPV